MKLKQAGVWLALGFLGTWVAAAPKESTSGTRRDRAEMREKMKTELGLSDEQVKQLEAHRRDHRAEMKQLWTAMKEKREAIKTELEKPTLDKNAVHQLNDQLKEVHGKLADLRLEGILRVREILTPDQFKKFMALRPGREAGKKGWTPGRGHEGPPEGMGDPEFEEEAPPKK
ncbi:MAG: Spy/CpxP family protein refolding chaperone [Elusimicrobia bacterium]|nr:Spy/CpxP family protein refolding chaperone [Elusimicrobiota bacterium]